IPLLWRGGIFYEVKNDGVVAKIGTACYKHHPGRFAATPPKEGNTARNVSPLLKNQNNLQCAGTKLGDLRSGCEKPNISGAFFRAVSARKKLCGQSAVFLRPGFAFGYGGIYCPDRNTRRHRRNPCYGRGAAIEQSRRNHAYVDFSTPRSNQVFPTN
ncbi:MAG: hypothetical protein LBL46_00520, partial [Rickettsiales bacterium]|nr:hypothetical protein [Rickettsiales bacterium]